MSVLWKSEEVAKATGGEVAGKWQAQSVSIDSRSIEKDGLFVAIIGERVDGHAYVSQAIENGAAAAIVSKPIDGVAPEKLVMVGDTTKALEELGIYSRNRCGAKIIGVTGSVGKTTTKECLRLLCQSYGRTYASKGNFNNHFGTPLSLANMSADTEYGIFEMGMNHAGEISHLTKMVKPHVAIITNVEAVHIEFFENEQAIAKAKSEIFEGLSQGGTAIINADNEHCDIMTQQAKQLTDINLLYFGQSRKAEIQLVEVAYTGHGSQLVVSCEGHQLKLEMRSGGVAIVSAVLVALTVAKALGLDIEKAVESLQTFEEVQGRGQLTEVVFDDKHMWWMDDSYNASPASMRAAFAKLEMIKSQKQAKRSIAVLGDMLELGEHSKKLHEGLATSIAKHGVDVVYTVGELMRHLHEAIVEPVKKYHADDLSMMQNMLKDQLQASDVVLFKGSNGSKIHQLVKELRSE